MTLPDSHLLDLSKTITSTFNKSFYRLNSEYLVALQQLEQWSESEYGKILRQYQEREKALQISFEAMTKDYSDQFQKQIEACEKASPKKSKNAALVTYLTAKFTSISADLQNKVIQIFQQQAKQIIKNGAKASPDKSPPPVPTNAPPKSEVQPVKSQTTEIKPAVKQTVAKTAPPKSEAQPTSKANTAAKSEPAQIKPVAQKTGAENIPSKSGAQPVKPDTTVKSQPTQVKPVAQQTGTGSVPSKSEVQPVKPDTTVKFEPAQIKPVVEKTATKIIPANCEVQPTTKANKTVKSEPAQIKPVAQSTGTGGVPSKSEVQPVKPDTTVKSEAAQIKSVVETKETKVAPSKCEVQTATKTDLIIKSEPVQIKPVAKKAEAKSAVAPNALPPTTTTTTNPDVSLDISGLFSISVEPPKAATPPKSAATIPTPEKSKPKVRKYPPPPPPVVYNVPTPLPARDYIAMIYICSKEIAALYKADEKNSACVIETMGKDLSTSKNKAKQLKLAIANVQGFCWLSCWQRYALISTDTVYLYDQKKSKEIHRQPISGGTGQAGTLD